MSGDHKRIISIFLVIAVNVCAISACTHRAASPDLKVPETFRDIPGITRDEIMAVEQALATKSSFIYSLTNGVECFYRDDGSIGGYGVLICDWLSKFLGIPFTYKISLRNDLADELLSGKVDFSGDFKPMSYLTDKFIMTDPIDMRIVKYARYKGSPSLSDIASKRPVRYCFVTHGSVMEMVQLYLKQNGKPYTIAVINDYNNAIEKLRNNQMDILIAEASLIDSFTNYTNLETGQYSPLMFKNISITTADPQLRPIIDILNKYLSSGGMRHLHDLYREGQSEFSKTAFINSLNTTETAYYTEHIRTGRPIPYAISANEYPIQYYDKNDGEWAGIAVDVIEEISKITGLAFLPVSDANTDSAKIYSMLTNGDALMAVDLIHSDTREPSFLWADDPYVTDQFALISRMDFNNIDTGQMLFYRVGKTLDIPDMSWIRGFSGISAYSDCRAGLEALKDKRIDLLITSENRFITNTNNLRISGLKINLLLNDTSNSKFAFNIREKTLRDIITKAQAFVNVKGIADSWRFKTFDYQEELAHRQGIYTGWILASLIVILGLFAWLFFMRSRETERLTNMVAKRTQELEEQTQATKAASMAKSDFLAVMSHEMRTPMNAVIGFTETMLSEEECDKNYANCTSAFKSNLEKIHVAGMTLLNIINDILDISKIESGKFEIIPEYYDLPSLINDTVALNIIRISDKLIKFVLEADESLPASLWGDELRIKQICNNLLSNAFKYTKSGTVTWRIDCEKEIEGDNVWITISVRDTGVGIREEDLNKLFTAFNQLDTKSNRRIEGTGLGLLLTKRMAEMMGGYITVESEYGKGSLFTVRIMQKKVTDAVIGPKVAEELRNFQYSADKRLQNVKQMRIRLPYAKILIVDDVRANLEVAKALMKPYGMQIDTVTSGADAIEAIRQEKVRYSAIFMDHMMPEMDGVEATRIIRHEIGTEYARNIPVIMLTANAILGNEEFFLSQGFNAFLSKPIDNIRLDLVIRQWVRDKNLEKELAEQQSVEDKNGLQTPYTGNSIPEQSGVNRKIDGLDFDAALERFGDEGIILDILRVFMSDTPKILDQIRNVTDENLQSYIIAVHGIKGGCRGISAEPAAKLAENLELEAKAGNFVYVKAHNAAFIKYMEKLLADLKNMPGIGEGDKRKKEGDKRKKEPDRGALTDLLEAGRNFDVGGVAAAMAELENYEYENNGELIEWLKENLKTMNLTEITGRLSQILETSSRD